MTDSQDKTPAIRFSESDLELLRSLLKKDYDLTLSDDQLEIIGNRLINFYSIVLKEQDEA